LERRKFRKVLTEHLETTYTGGGVALKRAGIDLDICTGTRANSNSSAREVACPPPGHSGKFRKVQESSADHHSSTYIGAGGVALESAVVYIS
jgi:hypothetical protein